MYNLRGRTLIFIYLYVFASIASSEANEISLFSNTKEARSQLIPEHKNSYYLKQIEANKNELQLLQLRLQDLSTKQNVCEEEIIKIIDLEISGSKFEEKVHLARFAQIIDNVTESILLKFPHQYFLSQKNHDYTVDQSLINWPKETSQDLIIAFGELNEELNKNKCWSQILIKLITKINPGEEKLFKNKKNIIKLYQKAFLAGAITESVRNNLTHLTKINAHRIPLTLSDYINKRRSVLQQFPESKQTSPATLPSKKIKRRSTLTYREKFINKYDVIQIALLRKTLVNMRARFESNQIEIHIFNDNQDHTEIIPLDPMERYRFVVKLFRKEWDLLRNHSSFKGIDIEYTDFLLAGFETGLIATEELELLTKLEELWNPHSPWWEKALYWGTTIGGSIASTIPQPYGYIAVLGIVVIEGILQQFIKKGGLSEDQTHSLF